MDACHKSNRKFPSYTLVELESFVAAGLNDDALKQEIVQEIADRKAGTSKPFVVPQIECGPK